MAMSQQLSRLSGCVACVKVIDRPMHHRLIMEVERTARGVNVYTDCKRLTPKRERRSFMTNASPVLALLRRPDCTATKISVCLEDGFVEAKTAPANMVAFCAGPGHRAVLIPDLAFLTSHGYDELRRWATLNWREWNARSDTILWRGVTTGNGRNSSPEMIADQLKPRVQLCLLAKGISGTDMKIVRIVRSNYRRLDRDRIVQAGILGERTPVEAWAGHKFAIDIDGNSNSFGTMLCRQILGCCVLKVGSPENWSQWYYDREKPWVHFIPIQSDLSDLAEKIAWCREHDRECQQIAAEGRILAISLDGEGEIKAAVQRINAAYP
jgi:hypothetical protein